jgi:hypothetical protein
MKFLGQEIALIELGLKRSPPGAYKSWVTKFFIVVPNIFSIISTIFFKYMS